MKCRILLFFCVVPVLISCGGTYAKMVDAMDDPGRFSELLATVDDINMADDFGTTLLLAALEKNKDDITLMLIAKGADVTIRDRGGRNALERAVLSGNDRILAGMIRLRPDIVKNREDVDKLVRLAVESNAAACIRVLLDGVITADYVLPEGMPVLHLACSMGGRSMSVIEELVGRKADVNGRDSAGWTPLFHVTDFPDYRITRMLVKRGADLNIRDRQGHSVMYVRAAEGLPEYVRVYLTLGGIPEPGMFIPVDHEYTVTRIVSEYTINYGKLNRPSGTMFKDREIEETKRTVRKVPILEYAREKDPELESLLKRAGYRG